jgi:hypothetical protein
MDDYSRTELFCNCAVYGGESKIKEMKLILETDPKK